MDAPVKKSKKSKHKKSSRPPPVDDDGGGDLIVAEDPPPSTSKHKTAVVRPLNSSSVPSTNTKRRKKRDSASSDEERWLTAIESGKLEDVDDELKKIKPKDPALMTARQRAMYDRGLDGSPSLTPALMSLPTGYKEKVMTAEAIQKAAIKSQKRKQMADEKREKDKKKTMERLLKKQESKTSKSSKTKTTKTNAPMIIYKQNVNQTILTFPSEFPLPFKDCKPKPIKKPVYCIMDCGNLKKYSCSRTNVPLCSLTCYKRNIANVIL